MSLCLITTKKNQETFLLERRKNFIKKNPLPSSEKLAAQKLERLEANIEFMDNLKEVNNET